MDGPSTDEVEIGAEGWQSAQGGHRIGAAISALLVRLALTGAVLAYLVVIAQLGLLLTRDHDALAATPSLPPAPETPTASPLRMGPASTGVVAVDAALSGFLMGDVDVAFSRLVVHVVQCGTLPWGGTPALACSTAEAPGTVHQMILSACEPGWVTIEAAKTQLGSLLTDTPGLYAVTRVGGGYTAVLSWVATPDRMLVLSVSSGNVTSYGAGCGRPLAGKAGSALEFVTTPGR